MIEYEPAAPRRVNDKEWGMRRVEKKTQENGRAALLRQDAGGIDVGANELYVAVPPDRTAQSVRCFGVFTEDLQALTRWLKECGVKTVAMESTGVYWIAPHEILEAAGIEVYLVNARHVQDCQWLQYLHSVGLLRASYIPSQDIRAVRALIRHRDMLVRTASSHIQHMQKALNQMNLHLHNVISDITGKTGLAIIDAILAGERDRNRLAALRDSRIKVDQATIAKSLEGNYRPEHVFTLRQSLELYRFYQRKIGEVDAQMQAMLQTLDKSEEPPAADWQEQYARLMGTDLGAIQGISTQTMHVIYSELGGDMSDFPSEKHFCSWLGVSPNNRISGKRILSSRTSRSANRVAHALRSAANTLHRSQSQLGFYFRRMKARLGSPMAITATAHKLARIVYHMLKTRQPYDETVFARNEVLHKQRLENRLRRQAQTLGFELVAVTP